MTGQALILATAVVGLVSTVVGLRSAIVVSRQNGAKLDHSIAQNHDIKVLVNGNLSQALARLDHANRELGEAHERVRQLEAENEALRARVEMSDEAKNGASGW